MGEGTSFWLGLRWLCAYEGGGGGGGGGILKTQVVEFLGILKKQDPYRYQRALVEERKRESASIVMRGTSLQAKYTPGGGGGRRGYGFSVLS
jgi:hypothetical protein